MINFSWDKIASTPGPAKPHFGTLLSATSGKQDDTPPPSHAILRSIPT